MVAAALVWALPLFATQKVNSHWLQEIQGRYREIKSITANFEQLYASPRLGEKRSQGTVKFQFPGKMYWKYSKPNAKAIVSDGKKSWIYDPADKQLLVLSQKRETLAMSFLWGDGELDKLFIAENVKPSKKRLLATLVPRKAMPGVEKLRITYDRKKQIIVAVVVYDLLGNRNEVNFSNIVVNKPIDAKVFSFQPPPGVEVVRY